MWNSVLEWRPPCLRSQASTISAITSFRDKLPKIRKKQRTKKVFAHSVSLSESQIRFIWNRSCDLPWTLLCEQTATRPLPFCRTGPWSVHDYLHSVFWAECEARTPAEASNPAYEAPCKSCHSDSPTKVSQWKKTSWNEGSTGRVSGASGRQRVCANPRIATDQNFSLFMVSYFWGVVQQFERRICMRSLTYRVQIPLWPGLARFVSGRPALTTPLERISKIYKLQVPAVKLSFFWLLKQLFRQLAIIISN